MTPTCGRDMFGTKEEEEEKKSLDKLPLMDYTQKPLMTMLLSVN